MREIEAAFWGLRNDFGVRFSDVSVNRKLKGSGYDQGKSIG
jgi:hypothetical protein